METFMNNIIGVLALQGDFSRHIKVLHSLGVKTIEVRKPEDLAQCSGLIIPGGESTVMLKQLDFIQMREKLIQFAKTKPVFGTCAGLILMSSSVIDSPMKPLGILDISVERNAFGRQIESFRAPVDLCLPARDVHPISAIFIRAPRIRFSPSHVQILATYENEPVLVQQGHHLGASFHPELTDNTAVHEYFISIVDSPYVFA